MNDLERLEQLLRVEPPAELDALVLQRLGSTLARVREEARESGAPGHAEAALQPPSAAVALPLAERWVYTLGLVTFGTQALQLVARVVWRTLAGRSISAARRRRAAIVRLVQIHYRPSAQGRPTACRGAPWPCARHP